MIINVFISLAMNLFLSYSIDKRVFAKKKNFSILLGIGFDSQLTTLKAILLIVIVSMN